MKRNTTYFSPKLFLIVFVSTFFIFSCRNHRINEDEREEGNERYDEAAAIQQLEVQKTIDPTVGYVPTERLINAFGSAERSKQIALTSRTGSTMATWVERGPTADAVGASNGNTRNGSPVASGRVTAIWVDLSDATGNTVWIGGIGGGLWKTTNFKSSSPTWTSVNDFFTNMSISSICQDPTNYSNMYFGTGEKTWNIDAIRGNGVWKSTDHGTTWAVLSGTSTYMNVSKVLCDALGNLYVGVLQNNLSGGTSGFFRSTNGGSTFSSNISPSGIDTKVTDFVISSTGRLHICTGYYNPTTPGYRYTDNPATVTATTGWTTPTTSFPVTSTTNINCALACKGDTLYAIPSDNTSNVPAVYKSTDGGSHWAVTSTSPPNSGNTGFCGSQGWYCLGAEVNPVDGKNVIIGSLNCYATTDGGATWSQISDWVTGPTGQYIHSDIHNIKWGASNQVIVASDGGVFYSPDGGATFSDRNSGLNIKQFYSCAFHPTLTDYFLAGAQDNGCHQFNSPGLGTTTEVTGGDGSFVHIDQSNPSIQICSYVYNKYRLSTDGGTTWNYYSINTTGKPVNPTDYDNAKQLLYGGNNANLYTRWDPINSPSSVTAVSLTALGNSLVSAVTVSPHVIRRVFFGSDVAGGTSKVLKVDSAHSTPVVTSIMGTGPASAQLPTNLYVSCVAVGPNTSDNDLIVTYSSYDASLRHVFYSTNGGSTWTNISGNLPDMPVRWAVFDPTSNTKAWIATETGVWSTTAINGSSTVWTASPGFPTVRTDMIKVKYSPSEQTLIAATHGRGLWTQTTTFSVLPINNFVLRGNWKTNSTVELSWDFANAATATFDIESSKDGTYFSKSGSSLSATTFLDQPGTTDIYYRVKGKNIFGNVSYSNVIHLQKGADTKDISGVKIYPNPVKDNINIAFDASGQGIIDYRITGINGQVCWEKEELISSTGDYLRTWNIQALKPGTYVFTTTYNNKKITQKFNKL